MKGESKKRPARAKEGKTQDEDYRQRIEGAYREIGRDREMRRQRERRRSNEIFLNLVFVNMVYF